MKFFASIRIPTSVGSKRFSEVWADFQRKWFQAIAPSLVSLVAGKVPDTPRFWSERSKGSSKDADAALATIWLLAFSLRPLSIEVAAADREQALELKKAAVDILRLNSWLSTRLKVQLFDISCPKTGSEARILAADIAGSHGSRPDVLIANELSHVAKREFVENLFDNLAKKANSVGVILTNAGHVGTWQHEWRMLAQESDRWHFHQVNHPAPWISNEELEEARRRNSKSRFLRLFHGVWCSQLGDALDQSDVNACVSDAITAGIRPSRLPSPENWRFTLGVDLGIRHDHAAIVALGSRTDSQEVRLIDARSWAPSAEGGEVDLSKVESSILDWHRKYGFANVCIDPWQAALLRQRLERQGVPCKEVAFVGKNLNEMATCLLETFRSRRIVLYRHETLLRDLSTLSIEEKSYGHRLVANRTSGGHADLATAFCIALPTAVADADVVFEIGTLATWGSPDYHSPFMNSLEMLDDRRLAAKEDREYWDSVYGRNQDDEAFRCLMVQCGRAY